MEKPSFVWPFGFGRSGGLPKYGKTKFRSDVLKNGKIPRFVRVCFRVPKNGKILRFDLVGFRRTENQETKIRKIGWASEERKPKDSIGWASEKRKPKDKDSCGGLPTNENPKIKIRKCGGLLTNENPKIKIRSGGFRLSKERKKLKIRSVSSEKWKKPRFVIQWAFEEQRKTKIRLVSRVGSDKQKKTKDSFGGFPKDQDSRTLGEWQRTAAKKSAKVRPALDHKLA
ncbi:unnamed protein product [Rhizophagus irregularis]|uniref:Uncharacterized protein n=1 Tax=Rhizophagus irregularis TaxID=588596 RepID=A0A915YSU2_9GLOM|nr:unnamed protein product [Rhizophagus irregularis]